MRGYGQYCPVSRAAEVLGERWTMIIVRNLLLGATTFNAIADGAPGMSRSLLSKRLEELERSGIITITAKTDGRGSRYEPTEAGTELWELMEVMGRWGARWLQLQPSHANPDVVLWSWATDALASDRLPDHRVVVTFVFDDTPAGRRRYWLLFDRPDAEVCTSPPDHHEDLVVEADPLSLARWHDGSIEWHDAVRAGHITVHGPTNLARQLPTWNRRSRFAGYAPQPPPDPGDEAAGPSADMAERAPHPGRSALSDS